MCGIAGKFFFHKNNFNAADLPRMMKAISHRGPDSSGTYTDGRIALGFQRLSIIDVATGNQPLYNETGKIVLIANGEIYNFRELRIALESSGHVFRTRSDCEVILHLYEEYGNHFIDKLNGMFAFCLYDSERQLMLIARDRMGIKPLYYCRTPDAFIFASEIKGLLAAQGMSALPEADVLDEFLCFGSLGNGKTFFSGITSLAAGSFMEITGGGVQSRRYWRPELLENMCTENQLVEQIESSLSRCVLRQMVSDVPLGSLLSGGVDSGWISAIAGKLAPGLKTFTVGFHEKAYDETEDAHLIAKTFGLDDHHLFVGNKEFTDALPEAIRHNEEPLVFASSVQTHLICKYARNFVKVLLSGEGADELFGGYPRQYIGKLYDQFLSMNQTTRSFLMPILHYLPVRRLKTLRQSLVKSPYDLVLWNAALASKEKIAWLLDKEDVNIANRTEQLHAGWHKNSSVGDNLLLFDQRLYLQSLLTMRDKMSMAASLELRVPILDNEMISLAHAIPVHLKLKHLQPKYLFKKAAARNIPGKIVYKRKIGFVVPMGAWLKDQTGLGRHLDLLIEQADKIGGVNRTRLEKIIIEHRQGIKRHEDILWRLISYSLWRQIFIDQPVHKSG